MRLFWEADGLDGLARELRYTACESDTETGLYYYRARYYDQSAGRFLNEDSVMMKNGRTLYTYVENSPTAQVDPYGLFPIPDCIKKILSPYFPGLNLDTVDLHKNVPLWPGVRGGTLGNDVFIAIGEYDPNTIQGIGLIAHEVTHVQQFQTFGTGGFSALYGFDLLMSYYWDRDFDKAYWDVYFERKARDVARQVMEDLLRRYGGEGKPCSPETKKGPCGQ
jgi:RHS repeat-associated protein